MKYVFYSIPGIILIFLMSCSDGYNYYSTDNFPAVQKADVHILIRTNRHSFVEQAIKDNFSLVSYRTISEAIRGGEINLSEAVVKILVDDDPEVKISISESTGPVGAMDHAMRIAFGEHLPELKEVELQDYKVRILQTGLGTDSIVQVLMKSGDGKEIWWTCGAHSSIIEASWQALGDSFRYKLLQGKMRKADLLT